MFRYIATFVSGKQEVSTGGGLISDPQVAMRVLQDELHEGVILGFIVKRGVLEEQNGGKPFFSHIMPPEYHPKAPHS